MKTARLLFALATLPFAAVQLQAQTDAVPAAPSAGAVPAVTSPSSEPAHPLRVSGRVMQNFVQCMVEPVYPEHMAQPAPDPVVLHAVITPEGKIADLSVISGSDVLRQPALDAIRQWTFRPYLIDEKPVTVETNITAHFVAAAMLWEPSADVSVNNKPVDRSHVTPASQTSAVQPIYPTAARAAHIQGIVVLKATINTEGKVVGLKAVSGPPQLLDATINAVRTWTYHPYCKDGQPLAVDTTVSVNFVLNSPNR